FSDYIKFSIDDEEYGRVNASEDGYWDIGDFNSTMGPVDNPWKNASKMAPFDKEVLTDVWNGHNQWLPTWERDVNNGENAALQVEYIRVWAL
ncbi:hypothetical protein C0J52_16374, partial [Blattella germanica]